jgi:16S rRNA (cytosine967-C5)-methyltransferase
MRPGTLLDHCADLLRAVLAFDSPADAAVAEYCRRHRALGPRDRQVLADTVFAVLRERLRMQHLAQGGGAALERRLAIIGWQGDAAQLDAGLSQAEREWLDGVRAVDAGGLPDALRHNLPDWLADALRAQLDPAAFHALTEALLKPAPLDVRVNVVKARREDVRRALREAGIGAEPTPYSPVGLRIEGRPVLNKLDLFRAGEFEVQDEGSQLLALLVEARRGEIVVDFCAGAGGKTLALGAAMRDTGRLYAFDTSGHRLDAMKPRLARAGLTNVHPVQIAHERDERVGRLAGKADRVLVDAPCSGLGTLRRNPDLKWRQTPASIEALCAQQGSILEQAARLVKAGGRLVYATCSLLAIENEAIARTFEQSHPEFSTVDAAVALRRCRIERAADLVQGPRLRLWPHLHETDGFYAALWQRR